MSDYLYPGEHTWRNCTRCGLSADRNNVVLTRRETVGNPGPLLRSFVPPSGDRVFYKSNIGGPPLAARTILTTAGATTHFDAAIPAILTIGEAPGRTEDCTGFPFMGESRRILRHIWSRLTLPADLIFTNAVSCRPTQYNLNNEAASSPARTYRPPANRPPTPEELKACSPKLEEVATATPYCAILYIGKVPLETKLPLRLPTYNMIHPAAITRMEYKLYSIKEQALLFSRFLENVYAKVIRQVWESHSSKLDTHSNSNQL